MSCRARYLPWRTEHWPPGALARWRGEGWTDGCGHRKRRAWGQAARRAGLAEPLSSWRPGLRPPAGFEAPCTGQGDPSEYPSVPPKSGNDGPRRQIRLSSVQFSRSVLCDSLQPHELQHTRPPCPSPTPRVYSNSCPSCRQKQDGKILFLQLCSLAFFLTSVLVKSSW